MIDLPERIRQLRISATMTQKELADKLGVSQNAIYNWENGKREPNVETLEKIAKLFNITISQLLEQENNFPSTIAAHFDGDEFTEDELDEIMKFMEFVKSRREKDLDQNQK